MAANKFATTLCRKTNLFVVILVYALLEWTLIALLFANSLLALLISNFVSFFGLDPPCAICSRIDHLFDTEKTNASFLCDLHSAEISKLAFCSTHRRLVDAGDMCEECWAAARGERTAAMLKWMKRSEEGERDLRCSCCGDVLESGFYSPFLGGLRQTHEAEDTKDEKLGPEPCSEGFVEEEEEEDGDREGFYMELQKPALDGRSVTEEKREDHLELEVEVEEEEEERSMDFDANCEVSIGSEICESKQMEIQNPRDEVLLNLPIRKESNDFDEDRAAAAELVGATMVDGDDELLTVEHLKSALKSEREMLNAMYAELEEERSAAAIATNQTMAMINRLQEEKAAVKMEALQYQRMMEEQSEYDQEALHLLNEIIVKKEKEKQELEKELKLYRKKILLYEAREKGWIRETIIDWFDENLNSEGEEGDLGVNGINHFVEESFDEFEDKRLAILDHLNALEVRLFSLDDDDDLHCFDGIEPSQRFSEEENGHFFENEVGDYPVNGFLLRDFDGKNNFTGKSTLRCKGKKLLPLFEAVAMDEENVIREEEDVGKCISSSYDPMKKKLAIAEEIENFYERLVALEEEDKKFFKQCFNSLKNGDKGVDLLQKILMHLRELRSLQPQKHAFCPRNPSEGN